MRRTVCLSVTALVLTLIGITPSAGEIRVHLTLCNNTQATLTIRLSPKFEPGMMGVPTPMPDARRAAYGEYTVNPVTCLRVPNAVGMGASLMDVYALNVSGQPGFTREFWVTKTTPREFQFFDRDFGISAMFDSRGGGHPIGGGPFDGTWESRQKHSEGPWKGQRFTATLTATTTNGITRMQWPGYYLEGRIVGEVYGFTIYRGSSEHGWGKFSFEGGRFFRGAFRDKYEVSGEWLGCRAPCDLGQLR